MMIDTIDVFEYCDNNFKSITLPRFLKNIEFAAFYGCEKLKSIMIPNCVDVITLTSFEKCYSLKHVAIPFISTKYYLFNDAVIVRY